MLGDARVAGIEVDGEMLLPICEICDGSAVVSVAVEESRLAGKVKVFVNLHIDGAARPIDVNGSGDVRELGFGLAALAVSAVAPAEPVADVDRV